MNARRPLIVAAIAAVAVYCVNRPVLAQDAIDELVEVDVQTLPEDEWKLNLKSRDLVEMSTEVARRELEMKAKALELQMAVLDRQTDQAGEGNDRRQLDIARQQLVLQRRQLELQRAAMERARMGTGRQQGRPLRDQIRDATRKLRAADDDSRRTEVIDDLEALLHQFFDRDMERRQGELTKIEQRLEKLRAQLDRRREKKQEIVDLQLKVILNEADGLGFYNGQGPLGATLVGLDPLIFPPDSHGDLNITEPMPEHIHVESIYGDTAVPAATAASPLPPIPPVPVPSPAATTEPAPQ